MTPRNRRRPSPSAAVIVVVGPPGSGKSTYVQRLAQPGDLVLDYDTIYSAISTMPHRSSQGADPLHWYTMHAWAALLDKLEDDPNQLKRAWIISSLPEGYRREALAKRLRATVVLMDADEATCRNRIAGDTTRDDAAKAKGLAWLPRWFKRYTPAPVDTRGAQT